MKRYIVGTALAVALLAGQAQADTTLQLTEVITSPQRTELLKGMIAKFEAANPGVKVEVTSLPWGQAFEKLATMVQGGQIPDVVEMPDRWLSLYANNGQLESLKPWMDQWPETKELTDRTIEFGSVVKDTPYMIPYGFYIRAMFWNKKLFKQAGMDEPPETMADFMEASKKIAALGGGKTGYCLRGGPGRYQRLHDDDGQRVRLERVVRQGRQLVPGQARGRGRAAVPGRHVQERLRLQGQRQLGLQRDRGRVLLGHLRHARPGPGRADRGGREDAQGGLRGGPHAAGPARQVVPDHRLCRLGDVHRQPAQGGSLEADRLAVLAPRAISTGRSSWA